MLVITKRGDWHLCSLRAIWVGVRAMRDKALVWRNSWRMVGSDQKQIGYLMKRKSSYGAIIYATSVRSLSKFSTLYEDLLQLVLKQLESFILHTYATYILNYTNGRRFVVTEDCISGWFLWVEMDPWVRLDSQFPVRATKWWGSSMDQQRIRARPSGWKYQRSNLHSIFLQWLFSQL